MEDSSQDSRPFIPDTRAFGEGSNPFPVWIHPSCGPAAISAKRRRALLEGVIPPLFHYESVRQSQLWLEVARRYQPKGLELFYRRAFESIRDAAPGHLVALGCGGGWKERWLLEAVDHPERMRFTPVDGSVFRALESALQVGPWSFGPVRPLVADVLECADLPAWLGEFDEGQRRRFTAFGLTPNADPAVLIPRLRDFLRTGSDDELLISANLMPDGRLDSVLGDYDNPETRRWLRQLVADWGLVDFVGDLEFVPGRLGGCDAVVVNLPWKKTVEFEWEGMRIRGVEGESLHLFGSLRFTPDSFRQLLSRNGLAVAEAWTSDCRREGVARVKRE